MNRLNETLFEERITAELVSQPLYNQRKAKDFDIEKLVDREMLVSFLKAQENWQRLLRRFNDIESEAVDMVVREYNKQIDRGVGMLQVLRKGITLQGIRVKFVQFKPDMMLADDNQQLYEANRFSVVRQMRYSTAPSDKNNELDLCILCNGLPIITFELKNEATGQTVEHGINQYRTQRDKNNRMLRACLVHFAMDTNRCYMTTRLDGDKTYFLPFNDYNKETDEFNPAIPGNYATSYVWNEILRADSLLNLIQHFIKQIPNKKGGLTTIFPRFHQLRCVRRLIEDVKEKGVGTNYLVEHSAGSGKSNSMAWLAHQLSNLQREDNTPVFDSIIMVTDRIVLDRNIADVIKNFETEAGVVKDIRRGSVNLAKALESGHRIIVSTVQKFAFAQEHLRTLAGSRFAVIIDEAHTAMGNEAAKDIRVTLSTDEQLRNYVENADPDFQSDEDRIYGEIQASRHQMKHISYFAFTATPKERTFQLFGQPDGTAFDYYTMKQAIDEGFIVDVLKGYTTYQQMFELIENESRPQEETDELGRRVNDIYEKKQALREMMRFVNENPYVINYKAGMIVRHFMTKTVGKMKGQAKAMVVTSSRADAIRYKKAIDKFIAEEYDGCIKTLVAFSGTVEMDGQRYTEENLNGYGVKDNGIKIKFEEPDEKILIVAEKFQTGFDQPLLHTMYVDKMLGGVQCIQTLSRLNRCHPDKEDTMIIDFVNKFDDVKKAFSNYYRCTSLEGEADIQKLYDFKSDIENFRLFTEQDVNKVAKVMVSKTENPAQLSPMMRVLSDKVKEELDPMEQQKYRRMVNRYVRQYGFLAQIMDFIDAELEKFYIFCKLYYKFLPYNKETLPMDLLEKIDLNKYKLQLAEQGMIELENEDGKLKVNNSLAISNPQKEFATLKELLHELNEPFAGFLDENDTLIMQILEQLKDDPAVTEAFNARNTTDTILSVLKEHFGIKAYNMSNKYLNLMDVMNRNQAFTDEFFRKALDWMAEWTRQGDRPELNIPLLINIMEEKMTDIFAPLNEHGMRELHDVIETFFDVFKIKTRPELDGMNVELPNALNYIYRADNRLVDLRMWYRTVAMTFEPYLRKVYYILKGGQYMPDPTDRSSSLSYCASKFKSLNILHHKSVKLGVNTDGTIRTKPMPEYLTDIAAYYDEIAETLRNSSAHLAEDLDENTLNDRIMKFVALYLFVVMYDCTLIQSNISELLDDGAAYPMFDMEIGRQTSIAADESSPEESSIE